jgi:hypothetical protein
MKKNFENNVEMYSNKRQSDKTNKKPKERKKLER